MKLLSILFILFLVVGAYMVVKYNNYQLDNPNDRINFFLDYRLWLFDVGHSVNNIVGAVVKEPWFPQKVNLTNESNTTIIYGP